MNPLITKKVQCNVLQGRKKYILGPVLKQETVGVVVGRGLFYQLWSVGLWRPGGGGGGRLHSTPVCPDVCVQN